jgi:hypothetical protein
MPDLPSFDEMLSQLAGQAMVTQRVLDLQYLARVKAFEQFTPASDLARLFVPVSLALTKQNIECQFSTGSESLREIRLLNRVVSKRYQSHSISHTVRIEVRRSPLPPGAKIEPKRREEDGQLVTGS